jgi:hypothetical protein
MVSHPLFELGQGAAEPRRHGRHGDPEQACGLLAVEIENDAQRHDLALSGGERLEALCELGGEALADGRELGRALGGSGSLLSLSTSRIRPEPVEGGRPCDREQPRARCPPPRVEPPPLLERGLEGLAREVLRDGPVLRQVQQVAVHVVEELFRHRRERRSRRLERTRGVDCHCMHAPCTSPPGRHVTSSEPHRRRPPSVRGG